MLDAHHLLSGIGPTAECVCKPDIVCRGHEILSCSAAPSGTEYVRKAAPPCPHRIFQGDSTRTGKRSAAHKCGSQDDAAGTVPEILGSHTISRGGENLILRNLCETIDNYPTFAYNRERVKELYNQAWIQEDTMEKNQDDDPAGGDGRR